MKTLWVIFFSVFVAEVGDKTQLATNAFCGGSECQPLGSFCGLRRGAGVLQFIAVLVGAEISRFVTPSTLNTVAAIGFVMIGVWMLVWKS